VARVSAMPKALSGTGTLMAGPTLFLTHSAWGGSLFYLRQGAQAMFGTFSALPLLYPGCHFWLKGDRLGGWVAG
jgi:hypothetical protein